MRILLDMNVSWRFVEILNQAGHQTIHWKDIGLINAADDEVFDYAQQNQMVLITHDLDFGYIQRKLKFGETKLGVLLLRNSGGGISPDKHGLKLIGKLQELQNELLAGKQLSTDLEKSKPKLQLVK